MKIFWWQGGLHVEPENDDERKALLTLSNTLDGVDLGQELLSGPSNAIDGNDQ